MSRFALLTLVCFCGWMSSPITAADIPSSKPIGVTSLPAPTERELQIHQAFHERIEVAFADTPLTDALKFLANQLSVNVIVDTAALQDEGVDPSTPVNLELSGITCRSTLKLMLEPMQLTYMVENEVLKITTLAKASETLVTRVYPVRDLAEDAEDMASLVDAIKAGCAKPSYDELPVSITGVIKLRVLVIRQTHRGHEEVEALLRDLRAANVVEPDRRVN